MLLTEHLNQANDALKVRDFNLAIQLFDSLRMQYPDAFEPYFGLARAHFHTDRPAEAISFIQHYLNRIPTTHIKQRALAYDLLGQCYNLSNAPETEETYKQATVIDPECASAWHNLGLYYLKQIQNNLDTQETIKHIQRAKDCLIAAWPFAISNPVFLHSLASWHEQYVELIEHFIADGKQQVEETHNHYKRALCFYDKALQFCTDDPIFKNIIINNYAECLALYGHVFYQEKNYNGAKNFYQQCLLKNPDHEAALTQMGLCYLKEKNGSKARAYFEVALKNENLTYQESAALICNIGCSFIVEKNWQQAEAEFARAKQLDAEIDLNDELTELANARATAQLTLRTPGYVNSPAVVDDTSTTCSNSTHLQN